MSCLADRICRRCRALRVCLICRAGAGPRPEPLQLPLPHSIAHTCHGSDRDELALLLSSARDM
eukprot:3011965-Rhodomonas_salina.11